MLVDVVTDIVIARPRSEVAAFAADPDHVPAWNDNVQSVTWKTEPPLAVGTKLAFVALVMGRRVAYTSEVVEHQPGTLLIMRATEGPLPLETTYRWSSQDDGTAMTLRSRGEPKGISKLAAPVMAAALKRTNQKDLERLKAILEART